MVFREDPEQQDIELTRSTTMADEEPKKPTGKSKVEKMQPQVFAEDMSEEWSKDAITAGASFTPMPASACPVCLHLHAFASIESAHSMDCNRAPAVRNLYIPRSAARHTFEGGEMPLQTSHVCVSAIVQCKY